MTFTEWYKETCDDEWTEKHAVLMSYIVDYEEFCKVNELVMVWDG